MLSHTCISTQKIIQKFQMCTQKMYNLINYPTENNLKYWIWNILNSCLDCFSELAWKITLLNTIFNASVLQNDVDFQKKITVHYHHFYSTYTGDLLSYPVAETPPSLNLGARAWSWLGTRSYMSQLGIPNTLTKRFACYVSQKIWKCLHQELGQPDK